MAKTTTIRKDLLPYKAGVVRLIPLDENMSPDWGHAVATNHDFLQSTQIVETREMETLENGNGSSKDYPTSVTYTLTVISNIDNVLFHNLAAGRIEELPNTILVPDEFNWTLPKTLNEGETLEITFGENGDHTTLPAADRDGNYHFTIEDSYGNVLVPRDQLENGAYRYDETTHALQFSDDYKGQNIRVIYDYAGENAIMYRNDPVLRNREFRVEVYGLVQSAQTGDVYRVTETLERCSITGDISDQTTQISKNAPITYSFASTPVPEGVSVYKKIFLPTGTKATGRDEANVNPVNGGNDVFGTSVSFVGEDE